MAAHPRLDSVDALRGLTLAAMLLVNDAVGFWWLVMRVLDRRGIHLRI